MELKDTIDLMTSSDYKDRFKAEYYQVKIRAEKLNKMLDDYYSDKLAFTPVSPIDVLESQLIVMQRYIRELEYRAKFEDIEL